MSVGASMILSVVFSNSGNTVGSITSAMPTTGSGTSATLTVSDSNSYPASVPVGSSTETLNYVVNGVGAGIDSVAVTFATTG
jgi:hypothetical protein